MSNRRNAAAGVLESLMIPTDRSVDLTALITDTPLRRTVYEYRDS